MPMLSGTPPPAPPVVDIVDLELRAPEPGAGAAGESVLALAALRRGWRRA